jgi:hypothetical protein
MVAAIVCASGDEVPSTIGVQEPAVTVGAKLTVSVDETEPLKGGVIGFALNDTVTPLGGVETASVTGELKYSKELTVTTTDAVAPTSTVMLGIVEKEKFDGRASYAPMSKPEPCERVTPRWSVNRSAKIVGIPETPTSCAGLLVRIAMVLDRSRTLQHVNRATRAQATATPHDAAIASLRTEVFDVNVPERERPSA